MLESVPVGLKEAWRQAHGDVLQWVLEAVDDVGVNRALRWFYLLPALLLRSPHRGGAGGDAQLTARFEAFRTGQHSQLVQWHAQDVDARSRRQSPPSAHNAKEKVVRRAIMLVSEGHLSKACSLLVSNGIADMHDPQHVAEAGAKHPPSQTAVQPSLAEFGGAGTFRPDVPSIKEKLRTLPMRTGTGPDGLRNEYLRDLVAEGTLSSTRVIGLLDRYQDLYLTARLPAWWYMAAMGKSVIGMFKEQPSAAEPKPPIRPIGMGHVLHRAIKSSCLQPLSEALGDWFKPVQVGVGVPHGGTILVYTIEGVWISRPAFHIVKLDIKNWFNTVSRRAGLAGLASLPAGMSWLVQANWAEHRSSFSLTAGSNPLPFRSECGGGQGDPHLPVLSAAALQPHLLWLLARLQGGGGGVIAQADDMYAYGEPGPQGLQRGLYDVIDEFIGRVKEACHAEMSPAKFEALCRTDSPHRPVLIKRGGVMANGMFEPGMTVNGVPVGTTGFVTAILGEKVDALVSDNNCCSASRRRPASLVVAGAALSAPAGPTLASSHAAIGHDSVVPAPPDVVGRDGHRGGGVERVAHRPDHESEDGERRRVRRGRAHQVGGPGPVGVLGRAFLGGEAAGRPRWGSWRRHQGVGGSGVRPALRRRGVRRGA